MVVRDAFDWGPDAPPATPWADTTIYELHVRGFTRSHPGVPEALRGTYAGLAHPAAVEHLVALGVSAVELLPVHQFVTEPRAGRPWPDELLGLQLGRLLRPARRVLGAARDPAAAARRSTSSRRWSRRCTRPASR